MSNTPSSALTLHDADGYATLTAGLDGGIQDNGDEDGETEFPIYVEIPCEDPDDPDTDRVNCTRLSSKEARTLAAFLEHAADAADRFMEFSVPDVHGPYAAASYQRGGKIGGAL